MDRDIVKAVIVPLITCFISAFGGTWVGTTFSNHNTLAQIHEQQRIALDQDILGKRLEIIDRYARSTPIRTTILKYLAKHPDATSPDISPDITAYYSEYASIIIGAKIYFGPKTELAIQALNTDPKGWMEKDRDKEKAFMQAMIDEVKIIRMEK